MHDPNSPAPIPQVLPPEFVALQREPRWIAWRYAANPHGKVTKQPLGSTNRPEDWHPFAAVRGGEGVGLVLTGRILIAGRVMIALDIDSCRDPETGEVADWAMFFVRWAGCGYTEITPSGGGLRVWALVRDVPDVIPHPMLHAGREVRPMLRGKRPGVQLFGYGAAQYVTFTGRLLPGCSPVLNTVPDLREVGSMFGIDLYAPRAARKRVNGTAAPSAETLAPAVDRVEGVLRQSPFARAIFDAVWKDALVEGSTQTASEAYYRVALAALRAADNDVDVAADFLLYRTAWGCGMAEDSADPAKYARRAWVEAELERIGGKEDVRSVADLLDDGFDAIAWTPPAPSVPAVPRRSLLDVPAVDFGDAPPPPRKFLLHTRAGEGYMPLGKAALLTSSGGTGKTTALVQLAVALALRRPWLDAFVVGEHAGRDSLLLLGEEDAEEAQRKLYWTTSAMGLTRAEVAEVKRRVRAVPCAGLALSLLQRGERDLLESGPDVDDVRKLLGGLAEPGLVVIDPLSRFAGIDVESSNATATRFVQEVEQFTHREFGGPSVLLSGHSSKYSRREGGADSRGVTAIPDAVRWNSTLLTDPTEPLRVKLTLEKTNLTRPHAPVYLARGENGLLRVEGIADTERRDQERERAKAVKEAETAIAVAAQRKRQQEAIVERVRALPGLTTNGVLDGMVGKRAQMLDALRGLIGTGVIVEERVGARGGKLFVNRVLR